MVCCLQRGPTHCILYHFSDFNLFSTFRKSKFPSTTHLLSPAFLYIRLFVISVAVFDMELRSHRRIFVVGIAAFVLFISSLHAQQVSIITSAPLLSQGSRFLVHVKLHFNPAGDVIKTITLANQTPNSCNRPSQSHLVLLSPPQVRCLGCAVWVHWDALCVWSKKPF